MTMVHFQLNEVSSASALAWIAYARDALAAVGRDPHGFALEPDAVTTITGFFDEWERQAATGPTLMLSVEISEAELEFVGHTFQQVSQRLTDEADERGYDVSPPEGDEFYRALSDAVISTLEFSDEPASAEFGEVLRSSWPRTDRVDPPGAPGEIDPD
jgi:hypothetical protein